jgi:hypothetical protein
MAAQHSPQEISEPIEHEQPGEEEMPAPPQGEIAMPGKSDRPGKAALIVVAIGIGRQAKDACRVEAMPKNAGDALGFVAVLHGSHRQDGIVERGLRSDVEGGVSVEDL